MENEIKLSLCDECPEYFSFLIVAWGRELTAEEKQLNSQLQEEGKAAKCLYHERFFNQNFKKRTRSCEFMEA